MANTEHRKPAAGNTDASQDLVDSAHETSIRLRIIGCTVFVVALSLIAYGHIEQHRRALNEIGVVGVDLAFKPRDETRRFEYATLRNGMVAVTIQDKRALKKGFALAVQAGYYNDPRTLPGLAHFCEHMLFLGTEKFPEATGFADFMSAHGGSDNAATSPEKTVYYASLVQNASAEGFDRWADFFRAPLFNNTYVDKEVHAVDSEHQKNVQDPARQMLAVMNALADPDSPVSRFHTGNLETLQLAPARQNPPIDPVVALQEFFRTHYCPDRMKVVTIGPESNGAQLKEIEKRLGKLQPPSSACEAPRASLKEPNPWPRNRLKKYVMVQGKLPKTFLWVHFPLPDVTKSYMSQPLDYLDHVLKHSGENSLSRVLKDTLNLASGFDVMFQTSSISTDVFLVIQLTEQGREKSPVVLDVIFAYLASLRRKGVNTNLLKDIATVSKLQWDWQGQSSPSDTAQHIASLLTRVEPSDVMWADALTSKPNPALVAELMQSLNPDNMNVALVKEATKGNAETDDFFKGTTVQQLPYFNITYAVRDLSEAAPNMKERIRQWNLWLQGDVNAPDIQKEISDAVKANHLETIPEKDQVPQAPRRIEGIPKVVSLEQAMTPYIPFSSKMPVDDALFGSIPEKLGAAKDIPSSGIPELWYRGGWMRASPKVIMRLGLMPVRSQEEPEMGALDALKLELYSRILAEEINPKLVDLNGINRFGGEDPVAYSIGLHNGRITFGFNAFESSIPEFTEKVRTEFNDFNKNVKITPLVRWKRVLAQLRKDLTTYSDLPMNYALSDRNLLLQKGGHHKTELVEELDNLGSGETALVSVASSVSQMVLSRPMRPVALTMGNIAKDTAHDLMTKFYRGIEYPEGNADEQLDQGEVERTEPVVKLPGPVEVRKANPRQGDGNNVVVVSIMDGVSTIESRVLLSILTSIYNRLVFKYLRTEQQLGYIVRGGVIQLSNVQAVSCVAQGPFQDADTMEAAVHYVNFEVMMRHLEDMQDEELQALKDSFREQLLQPPTLANTEFDHFQGLVHLGGVGFNLKNEMLRFLEGSGVSKKALISKWKRLMKPEDGTRKVVAVKYFNSTESLAPRTLEQARQTWAKQGITGKSALLLEREFNIVQTLSKVDSKERSSLAKQGGWFPITQNLQLEDPDSAAAEVPPAVQKQLSEFAASRRKDIEKYKSMTVHYEDPHRIAASKKGQLRAATLDTDAAA